MSGAHDSRGRIGSGRRLPVFMPPDSLLRRVRWGNLARLLALPAVVLLVVLWPRLSPAPPRLPAARPPAPPPPGGAGRGRVAVPGGGGPVVSRAREGRSRAAQRSGRRARVPPT